MEICHLVQLCPQHKTNSSILAMQVVLHNTFMLKKVTTARRFVVMHFPMAPLAAGTKERTSTEEQKRSLERSKAQIDLLVTPKATNIPQTVGQMVPPNYPTQTLPGTTNADPMVEDNRMVTSHQLNRGIMAAVSTVNSYSTGKSFLIICGVNANRCR